MKTIKVFKFAGEFAENKDAARTIRIDLITPPLKKGSDIILDFAKVGSVTQSFIHALLSELMREFGPEILDKIRFKNCNENVKGIINIVVDYMQI
jgi:hypothetical protein